MTLSTIAVTSGITGLTSAPISTQYANAGSTNTWYPMTYQRAQHNGGFVTHLNTGLYKTTSLWGSGSTGWYAAIGVNDNYPTQSWYLTFDAYIQNSLGYVLTSGSFRAPIFYDLDNTGYYVDPAGNSSLYYASFANDLQMNGNYLLFNQSGTRSWNQRATGGNLVLNSGDGGGNFIVNLNLQAPLIYDSNDTGYYLNLNGTSNLFTIYARNTITSSGTHSTSYIQNELPASANGASTGIVTLRMWCSEPGITWDAAGFGYNVYNDGASPYGFGRANTGFGQAYMRMASDGNWYFYNTNTSNTRYTTMQLTNAGNASFNATVSAGSDFRAPIFYDSNNTAYYFDGSATGDSIRVAGDVVAYYSDERLKDRKGNIENALEKILSLDGFYYEANELAQSLGYEKKLEVGLSAQQVEAILPEIIKAAPVSKEYKTLNYGRLMPLVVEAFKEQQKEIEELKQLVNKLINK
jgi:hypothetical protein